MDERTAESIKKNSGLLRQLTFMNNQLKEVKNRVKKLEDSNKIYPNEAELARMHLREGND